MDNKKAQEVDHQWPTPKITGPLDAQVGKCVERRVRVVLLKRKNSRTGYGPNDFAEENNSEVVPTLISRGLCLCCVANSCEDDAITLIESEINGLHYCSVTRKKQVRTNQKFITLEEKHSGRRSSWFRSNIWESNDVVPTQEHG